MGRSVGWSGTSLERSALPLVGLSVWMRRGPCARPTRIRTAPSRVTASSLTARRCRRHAPLRPDRPRRADARRARPDLRARRRFPVRRVSAPADRRHRSRPGARSPPTAAPRRAPPTENGGALPATPLPFTGGALFARTNLTGTEPLSQVATASAGIGELDVALPLPALPAPDLSALPGGGVLERPRRRRGRHPARARRPDRADRPAAVGQGPDRRRERELPGRHARGERRLADRRALRARHHARAPTRRSTATSRSTRSRSTPRTSTSRRWSRPRASTSPSCRRRCSRSSTRCPTPRSRRSRCACGPTPGVQTVTGDKLTRQALHVNVELAGTPLLDAVVGEATVDATGVSCGSVAAAALGLSAEARLHHPQADADRRRPEGQPRLPAGRRRPAPLRRQDGHDPLAVGQAHGRAA